MDAAYGGAGQALQYEATALFDFTTNGTETLYLGWLSDTFSGIGFDSFKLVVGVDETSHTYTYSSLSSAEAVFGKGSLDLGSFVSGSQSVSLDYLLTYDSGTKATAGAGFGFAYDLAAYPSLSPVVKASALPIAPSSLAVPETSTWVMMLAGVAGLGWAGSRSRKRTDLQSRGFSLP
jgi:hypothetical protein